jgi:Dullard-like phosphatase family protein
MTSTTEIKKDWYQGDNKTVALAAYTWSLAYTWLCSIIAQVLGSSKTKEDSSNILDGQGNVKLANEAAVLGNHLTNTIVPPMKRKTLILDLDETLVHSTIQPVSHHHILVEVVIDTMPCTFYVIKRPHVDAFLKKVAEWYDVVIFTASMRQYADPLIDQLDTKGIVKGRLFRESCLNKDGNFIKDLSLIKQDLSSTIIIDNSPIAYSHNKENAVPIDNWMGDNPRDESLLNLLPFLNALRFTSDVRSILSLRI